MKDNNIEGWVNQQPYFDAQLSLSTLCTNPSISLPLLSSLSCEQEPETLGLLDLGQQLTPRTPG